MNTLITICARGGSKGIPGKNIKLINGKPLIAYSIATAFEFANAYKNTFIELSTDDAEIKEVAAKFGLQTGYTRPAELADDHAGKIDVIKHLLNYSENKYSVNFDLVLDLDVTSPLRNLNDLVQAFQLITENKQAMNLFSVNTANRNPYFNMVEQKENGFYDVIKKTEKPFLTRQSAPKVYDLNASFYFYKRIFFEKGLRSAITEASLIYEMPHSCFDLDHPIDFEFLSFLLEQNKLDFEL